MRTIKANVNPLEKNYELAENEGNGKESRKVARRNIVDRKIHPY